MSLMMKLPGGVLQECRLHDMLLVPDLSCNLLSVSKATEAGKTVEFLQYHESLGEEDC